MKASAVKTGQHDKEISHKNNKVKEIVKTPIKIQGPRKIGEAVEDYKQDSGQKQLGQYLLSARKTTSSFHQERSQTSTFRQNQLNANTDEPTSIADQEYSQRTNITPPANPMLIKDTNEPSEEEEDSGSSFGDSSSDYESDKSYNQGQEKRQQVQQNSKSQTNAKEQRHISALFRYDKGGQLIYNSQAQILTGTSVNDVVEHPVYKLLDAEQIELQNKLNESLRTYKINEIPNDIEFLSKQFVDKDFTNDEEKIMYQNLPKFKQFKINAAEDDQSSSFKHSLFIPEQNSVLFYSRFENGNLRTAIKMSETEYNLELEPDVNTKGHMHWFNFKVITTLPKGTILKLSIINLVKKDSLYSQGMLPIVYSDQQSHLGWHRDNACFDISYTETVPELLSQSNINQTKDKNQQQQRGSIKKKLSQKIQQKQIIKKQQYYTLSFSYEIKNDNEIVQFAHDQPYTYSMLTQYIKGIASNHNYNNILTLQTLTTTFANVQCKMITITEDINSCLNYYELNQVYQDKTTAARTYMRNKASKGRTQLSPGRRQETAQQRQKQDNDTDYGEYWLTNKHKKSIFVTGRVHPGEPQSSWSMEGLITFLLSDEEDAKQLRKNFIIYIVPMLNPDGVIHGNHRCSLLGDDLNRRWLNPSKVFQPTIYASKQLIKTVCEEREVPIFCDMHGHFRKRDPFMYCCSYQTDQVMYDTRLRSAFLRALPLMLSQRNPQFSFKDSRFRMEKFKETSARIVLFRQFGILNSVTLENSFISFPQKSTVVQNDNNKIIEKALALTNQQSTPDKNNDTLNEEAQDSTSDDQVNQDEEPAAIMASNTYHFTSKDYLKLGEDVGKIFSRFVPTRQNQRRINFISQKFLQVLHKEFMQSLITKRRISGDDDKSNQEIGNTSNINQSQAFGVPLDQQSDNNGFAFQQNLYRVFQKQDILPGDSVELNQQVQISPAKKGEIKRRVSQKQRLNSDISNDEDDLNENEKEQFSKEYEGIESLIIQQAIEQNKGKQQSKGSSFQEADSCSSSDSEHALVRLVKRRQKKKKQTIIATQIHKDKLSKIKIVTQNNPQKQSIELNKGISCTNASGVDKSITSKKKNKKKSKTSDSNLDTIGSNKGKKLKQLINSNSYLSIKFKDYNQILHSESQMKVINPTQTNQASPEAIKCNYNFFSENQAWPNSLTKDDQTTQPDQAHNFMQSFDYSVRGREQSIDKQMYRNKIHIKKEAYSCSPLIKAHKQRMNNQTQSGYINEPPNFRIKGTQFMVDNQNLATRNSLQLIQDGMNHMPLIRQSPPKALKPLANASISIEDQYNFVDKLPDPMLRPFNNKLNSYHSYDPYLQVQPSFSHKRRQEMSIQSFKSGDSESQQLNQQQPHLNTQQIDSPIKVISAHQLEEQRLKAKQNLVAKQDVIFQLKRQNGSKQRNNYGIAFGQNVKGIEIQQSNKSYTSTRLEQQIMVNNKSISQVGRKSIENQFVLMKQNHNFARQKMDTGESPLNFDIKR